MPDSSLPLLHRLIGGDPSAPAEVRQASWTSVSPPLLVVAVLLGEGPELLDRAEGLAISSRDRQLVALARAHISGEADRFDVLVRDHLSEHPDNLVASWIAGRPAPPEVPSPISTPDPKDTTS